MGFDYHNLCFNSVNSHTHTREKILENFQLFVEIVGTPPHKNNIINIEKSHNDYTNQSHANITHLFQTTLYIVNLNTKKGTG